MRRGRAPLLAALGLVSACSLFTDLSSFEESPTPGDGGAGDVALADALTPTDDAATILDGGADMSTDGGCNATFCDDFDDGPIGERWDEVVQENGGTITIDTDARSSPNAVRASAPPPDSSGSRLAQLHKVFKGAKTISCSFAVRLDTPAANENAHLDYFQLVGTAATGDVKEHRLRLSVGYGGAGLREDVGYSDGGCACPGNAVGFAAAPVGTWKRVRFDMDYVEAKVYVDDVLLANGKFGGFVPDSISVVLGIQAWSEVEASVSYDDLACTVTN